MDAIVPLKRRWMQQVAILNGKFVARDGRVDFNTETGFGYIYSPTPLEGVLPFSVDTVQLIDRDDDDESVTITARPEYVYYGHIELTEIEVTN